VIFHAHFIDPCCVRVSLKMHHIRFQYFDNDYSIKSPGNWRYSMMLHIVWKILWWNWEQVVTKT